MDIRSKQFLTFLTLVIAFVGMVYGATVIGPSGISSTSDGNFSRVFVNGTDVNDLIGTGYPQQSASYILWKDGAIYYAKNGQTGAVLTYANPQSALQAAHNGLPANGGLIYLNSGDYTFTGRVNITKESVTILGSSKGTWLNDGVFVTNAVSDVFMVNDADGFILKNIFILGNGGTSNTQVAINITNTDYWGIENIRIRDIGRPIYLNSARWGSAKNIIATSCAKNSLTMELISSSLNQFEDLIIGGTQEGSTQKTKR